MKLWQQDATTIARMVRNRDVSAREVAAAHLGRIDEVNGSLNAIVRRMDADALAAADKIDRGQSFGPLAGVVATSKINTDHKGYPTDDGVAIARDNMPVGTNATIRGLLDAGCVFAGRTNSPALGLRLHTGNALHGETINPLDPKITPGGSSGGAGVAVATGMCAIAQGNDIGGSVRWPAFCNGVVGLRPSMGRMTFFSTNIASGRGVAVELMATNGPLARTVADIRLALEAMSANGWEDPAWIPAPISFQPPPKPIRVALVVDDGLPMHEVTKAAVRRAGRHLSDAGYEVEEVNPPALDRVFTLWSRISEKTGLDQGVNQLLQLANDDGLTKFITTAGSIFRGNAAETADVLVERDQILRHWSQFFDRYPVIVMPVYTAPSMRANEDLEGPDAVQRLQESARYLFGLSALGVPALAVPVGEHHGIPHGVQIVARRWRDDLCLDAGDEIQKREGMRPVVDPQR
jgi:amidase